MSDEDEESEAEKIENEETEDMESVAATEDGNADNYDKKVSFADEEDEMKKVKGKATINIVYCL